jgi:hypothetical protein
MEIPALKSSSPNLLTFLLGVAMLAPAMGAAQVVGRGPQRSSTLDSAMVRVIAEALFTRLSPAMARAALDTTSTAWEVLVPSGEPSAAWRRVREHALLAVRGRPLLPTDTVRAWAKVFAVRINGDTLTAQIGLGSARKCPTGWMEDDFWALARWGWSSVGGWGAPTVKPNYWSESFGLCPP